MNDQMPAPPLPGDELKQSCNGNWYAYGLRDLRELFKGRSDLAGAPYAKYSDSDAVCKIAYRWDTQSQKWSLWTAYHKNYSPACHLYEELRETSA